MIVINARFLTQKLTGVQRVAVEICQRLPNQIGERKVVFVAPKTPLIHQLGNDQNILLIGFSKGQLWEQVDLPIFLNKNNNPTLINFVGIAPIFYKNKIMFLYDLSFKHYPEWFSYSFQKLYNLLIPISLKNSRKIITDSYYVKDDIIETYHHEASKIHVIYPAPSKKFSNLNLKREKIILTVSSIEPRKNISRVIKAFNKIKSEYKLVIVGAKNKTFSIFSLDQGINNDNVIFTGYLTDEELTVIYNKAELFIYASLFEGFGIPPLEAQASGCACVISNATSLPEVYENSVEYFNPSSIESIRAKIEEVLSDKEKIKKLKALGVKNVNRFSWERSTEMLIKILEQKP